MSDPGKTTENRQLAKAKTKPHALPQKVRPAAAAAPLQPDRLGQHPQGILQLQRMLGNRAVNQLLAGQHAASTYPIQAKLTVGAAHDPYEEEADRTAEKVMRMPAAEVAAPNVENDLDREPLAMQRTPQEKDEDEIQAKPLASTLTPLAQRAVTTEDDAPTQRATLLDRFDVNDSFENRLGALRGGGYPLPDKVRVFMEPRFGADFSGVRLHTGNEAAQLNRSISAQAFTQGSDIYLGAGHGDLESPAGQRLLAHELTHTIQQGATAIQPGGSAPLQREVTAEDEHSDTKLPAATTKDLSDIDAGAAKGVTEVAGPGDVLLDPSKAEAVLAIKPGSQQTFGLGRKGDQLYAIGSEAFAKAAGAEWLGGRESGEHAEIALLDKGIDRVWTTQDSCYFCFGYLTHKGIKHQALRANVFPQKWTHPEKGWTVVKRTPYGKTPYWLITHGKKDATYLIG